MVNVVDLFCGAGGLTHGMVSEGLRVVAGIDLDPACRHPFETNNEATFIQKDVAEVTAEELEALFGDARYRVLAGCAPCQPFSTYAQRYEGDRNQWGLLHHFARLAKTIHPDVVTMENVPSVVRHTVFDDFVQSLTDEGYFVWKDVVDSSKYGVPQTRRRMVLLASRLGAIELVPPTTPEPMSVAEAIGNLRAIRAGEADPTDRMHVASALSTQNTERIRASKPGGTWRDWPDHLVASCHRGAKGQTYPSVYGRMEWGKPAPTMTTQCFGYGNGRFGHPQQDRAISLREAAILQSFPEDYTFFADDQPISFALAGRLIGNAVPVRLGQAIGRSIVEHLRKHHSGELHVTGRIV